MTEMTIANSWAAYKAAKAAVDAAYRVVCLRCGKPMTEHYACRHDEPEFRIMERVMAGDDDG